MEAYIHKPLPLRRIDLVLAGARGQVGTALRQQLARQLPVLREETGIDLTLIAAFDRRGFAFDLQGLDPAALESGLGPRRDDDVELLFAHLTRPAAVPTLLIDCTASEEIADCYARMLTAGVGVVGANKRANSRGLAVYRQLQAAARDNDVPYRYETTVAAAVPLLGPLRNLRLRGEQVQSVEGVLSGSLSYILHRLHEGCLFSAAVMEARALGYTDPDPLEDLCATDLARKLLVVAREAGFALEAADICIEPLIDTTATAALPLAEILAAQDAGWQVAIAAAQGSGERLVIVAEASGSGGRIGVRRVPLASAFGQLQACQNLVVIRTDLQHNPPLTLSGAGAGAQITAAGLLSDVVSATRQLAGQLRGNSHHRLQPGPGREGRAGQLSASSARSAR